MAFRLLGSIPRPLVVPLFDRHIFHRHRAERVERSARRLHARGNVLEPCLVGGDLDRLARLRRASCLLDALPALPGELVVVPDGDERPTRARVLQVGIGQVALVDDAIALERERVVEFAGLTAIGNPADVVDRAVVLRRHLVGIFDDLVNEIAEVENETELIGGRRALVLEDHPAIAVELALIDALAADEGETDRPRIVRERRGDRPADAAAVSLSIGEAVPVDARRLEMTDQHARRPIRFRGDRRGRLCDDPPERFVLGDLDREHTPAARLERPPSPEDDALSDRDRRTRRPGDRGRDAHASAVVDARAGPPHASEAPIAAAN